MLSRARTVQVKKEPEFRVSAFTRADFMALR